MSIVRNCLIAAVVVTLVCMAGCRSGGKRAESAAVAEAGWSSQLVQAAAPSAAPTRAYFVSGLGLLVAGGLAAIAGARTMGILSMALGCSVSALGVVIARYPWVILLAFLLAVAALGAALFDRWRKLRDLEKNRCALSAAAQVIQNLPEGKAIKQGLADLGEEVAAQVREAVTPLKDQLRAEGKI